MRLLVSVRSAAEAVAALDGAANIVDAKDPARGPLGAVAPAVLAAILDQVPPEHPFSVALGDLTTVEDVHAAAAVLSLPRRPGPSFVKIGFAGVRAAQAASDLVAAARDALTTLGQPPQVIAVAYADSDQVDSPDPWELCEAARRGGAVGILLDTAVKTGPPLLELISPADLSEWVALAHLHELTAGVAGCLGLDDLTIVTATAADIIGVRGAACDGGRMGTVSAQRVAALVMALRGSDAESPGETPEPPPNTSSLRIM